MRFRDREDAGQQLAARLSHYAGEGELAVVLALPRGGVPVAAPVARALAVPLEVLVARKVGAPDQPELGIGAVAEGGVRVCSADALSMLGISEATFDRLAEREEAELRRRVELYRGTRPFPDITERTAILVDDGLATGGTARAALRALRQAGVGRLILAIPVAPPATLGWLQAEADEVVCLLKPEPFSAVG
jgi:putative phosphoribosyl transferase